MKCPVCKAAASSQASVLLHIYDDLCKYVHSSTPMHLDMRIPFATITAQKADEIVECMTAIGKCSSAFNMLVYSIQHKDLGDMHHRNADWLRDRLPPKFKRLVSSQA
jgi:hypothetical protein